MRKSGFTLIELSIVLVIIGLLIGGVTIGTDMLKSAKLRSTISDIEKYRSAIHNFRNKYNELPGDMTNATAMWGSDSSCPNTAMNSVPKQATCNGDGDGFIGLCCESGYSQMYETFRAWQHLANAGMIDGQYTGVGPGSSGWVAVKGGLNVPMAPIGNADFWLFYYSSVASSPPYHSHYLNLGADVSGSHNTGVALTPAEAYTLDTKIDDGMPLLGKVTVPLPSGGGNMNPNCSTSTTLSTSTYKQSYTSAACAMFINMEF